MIVGAILDGGGNGRAAGGLGAEEADRLFRDQAQSDQLFKGLANLGDQRAAGHGNHDVIGQTPAELLGDLEADSFGALGVVGTQVHVDEAPVVAVGDLTARRLT